MNKAFYISALALLAIPASAEASPIVYRGMNPHISPSAFPSYEPSVTNIANLTKPKNTGSSSGYQPLSDDELLKKAIQSTLATKASATLLSGTGGRQDFNDGTYIISTLTANPGEYTVVFYDANGSATSTITVKN